MARVSQPMTSGDIDFAKNGEPKQGIDQAVLDSNEVGSWALQDAPVHEEKFVIFKLADNTKEGGVYLPNEDDVINPETKSVERMRLLLGVTSPWVKDQKDLSPEYIKANRRTLAFPRGAKILRIPEGDKAALEFLKYTNFNIGNPKRKTGARYEFFEYNPMKQQQEALDKEMLEIEMAIKASNEPVESMLKHANYLGIVAFDEFGIPKTPEGIRKEYIVKAKREPVRFKKSLGAKEVEISYLIKKAISENLIDLGGHTGGVTWAAGGYIANIPTGRNTHEYLIELALTNSEAGKKFLSQLNTTLNKT